MKINKVSTLFFSPTKTTKSIVEAMADVFCENKVSYDITFDRDLSVPKFDEGEVLIVGVPVYGGRVPGLIREKIKSLKANKAVCIPVAVYGNRDFDDALLELADYASESGFSIAGAATFIAEHSFTSEISTGRPNKDDLAIAKEFASKLKEKIEASKDELSPVEIPGNRPYKEAPKSDAPVVYWAPETTDACDGCGLCETVCPMGIIENKAVTDASKCIHCFACAKSCPKQAKIATAEAYKKSIAFLMSVCMPEQKQPQLFI